MGGGRSPDSIPESAQSVLAALEALSTREREAHFDGPIRPWDGVPPRCRFEPLELKAELKARLSHLQDETDQRREYRARETLRNGVRWLLPRGLVLKETDGRIGVADDIVSVLLSLERKLGEIRETLTEIRRHGDQFAKDFPKFAPSPTEEERDYAKSMLAMLIIETERQLDAIPSEGRRQGSVGSIGYQPVSILREIEKYQDIKHPSPNPVEIDLTQLFLDPSLQKTAKAMLKFPSPEKMATMWGATYITRAELELMLSPWNASEEQVEAGWRAISEWRNENTESTRPGLLLGRGGARDLATGPSKPPSSHSRAKRTPIRRPRA
jgi:hypothetical protein